MKGMRFSVRALFLLTTGIALWVWVATIESEVATIMALCGLPALAIIASAMFDIWLKRARYRR